MTVCRSTKGERNGEERRRPPGRKKQKTVLTFTREQLEAHDRMVERDFADRFRTRLKAEFEKEKAEALAAIDTEWKQREELFSSGGLDGVLNLIQFTISIPIAVLVEEFGWKPIPKDGKRHSRSKISRFVEAVQEAMNAISEDELKDIRTYSEEIYEKYGVKIRRGEDE